MGGLFFERRCMRPRRTRGAGSGGGNLPIRRRQFEARLPLADQFQIKPRRQFGILDGTVNLAVADVDAEMPAQIVQPVASAGQAASSQVNGVDGAFGFQRRLL